MGERNYLELPLTGEIKINYLNIKTINIPISHKVFIFAASVTSYTIIKKTFR